MAIDRRNPENDRSSWKKQGPTTRDLSGIRRQGCPLPSPSRPALPGNIISPQPKNMPNLSRAERIPKEQNRELKNRTVISQMTSANRIKYIPFYGQRERKINVPVAPQQLQLNYNGYTKVKSPEKANISQKK